MKEADKPKRRSSFEKAIDEYIFKNITGECDHEFIPIKGTEHRSEYEPENVSRQEKCSICGYVRYCSDRRPLRKCELVIDNT